MLSDIFVDDHKHIDAHLAELLESLRAGSQSLQPLENLRKSIQRHIYFEETSLFPIAVDDSNRAKINGLEVEHAGIWQLIDKIQAYMVKGDLIRGIDRTEGLARLLHTHVNAELETVYSKLDKSENVDNKKLIEEFNKSEMPEGWVCKVLRRYRKK